ncbi:hypothetical protein HS1genome_0460 [Sulfodiicoccus acidiphilus]|uniref:DUF3211 domain-containing protein n=1 Tax=Sulfodiicoccus acidiphilus TaxID=1670455 RepID=A0A348B1L9_9CREN|nr:STK_08120 family protein [Sulfodiicoccus acidiphilus]BBD72071.1 hypothetical protein HS1genome_0460 [Sulfodiicoccus acidiphilus]GGU05597.1 hypothetical protein GCM10007116_22480 [Sulfodiicoccus acidiphilus]
MREIYSFPTKQEASPIKVICADPKFLLPKVIRALKDVTIKEEGYVGWGFYFGTNFTIRGHVYSPEDGVVYPFELEGRGKGGGKVTLLVHENQVTVEFQYEGWKFTPLMGTVIRGWLKKFGEEFDEQVTLERIKRKI